ncbi:MAG TPA: ABC transporter C-terminal domain-containing protein, partial [Kofleriaceae bacterium]|nr:ABC transporter C-terminal domain-containing protein [Kofleriaceae bacterium]
YHDRREAAEAAEAGRPERGATGAGARSKEPAPRERPRPTGPRKLTFKEKQELAGMEAAIHAAEARIAELERTVSDPDIFRQRPAEVPALVADLDAARAELDRLFARWQELESLAAAAPA